MFEKLFGKKKKKVKAPVQPKESPEVQIKQWQRNLKREQRSLDKQIRDIQREEAKVKLEIKKLAKQPHGLSSCKILAKQMVQSRSAVDRLHTTKAQMNSVSMRLSEQLSTFKSVGHLSKNTEVMAMMNQLTNVSAVAEMSQEMSREMMKAGLIDEIMEETFESMEEEDLEEKTEEAIGQIMAELDLDLSAALPNAPMVKVQKEQEEEQEEAREKNMKSRLRALKE